MYLVRHNISKYYARHVQKVLLGKYSSDGNKPAAQMSPPGQGTSLSAGPSTDSISSQSIHPPPPSSTGATSIPPPVSTAIPIIEPPKISHIEKPAPAQTNVTVNTHADVSIRYQTEIISEADISKKFQPFDDVPGPALLRHTAKLWTFIPILGNQVTASTIQYFLSAGKIFGSQLSWGSNLWLYRHLLDEYGPVVRLHGPFGGDVVILSRPEHASVVFQNEGPHPVRSSLDSVEKYRLQYRKYKHAGPFVMFGTEWEKLRKTVEEPLLQSGIKHFDKVDKSCEEFIVRIMQVRNRQEEVSSGFLNEIYKWSLECLLSVMLNKRLGFLDPRGLSSTSEPAMLLEDLIGATKAIRRCESGLHLWKFFETPAWRSLVKHCDSIDSILNRHLRKAQDSLRLKKQGDPNSKLDDVSLMECLLLKQGMVPEDVLTVLLDMLLLGVNMTSHSIAFMLYHLSRNPRAQQKLFEEISKVPENVTKDKVNELPYLKACLKESLRLKPPMPVLSRILTKDIFVHGYRIPKGTYMLLATFLSSIREEHFEDALKFHPERWLDSGVSKEMEVLASIPYGYGPKSCLAKDLAETQISLLIFKLIRKFRIEYHYGDINSTNRLLAAPDRPLKFRFVERL